MLVTLIHTLPRALPETVTSCQLEVAEVSANIQWPRVTAPDVLTITRILLTVDDVLFTAPKLARVCTGGVIDAVVAVAVLDLDVELFNYNWLATMKCK